MNWPSPVAHSEFCGISNRPGVTSCTCGADSANKMRQECIEAAKPHLCKCQSEAGKTVMVLEEGLWQCPRCGGLIVAKQPDLVALDYDAIWKDFEQFLEPYTCDLIIKPMFARNAVLIQSWFKRTCAKFGHPAQELVTMDKIEVINIIRQSKAMVDLAQAKFIADAICARYGHPAQGAKGGK